jgi:hypothetical protein
MRFALSLSSGRPVGAGLPAAGVVTAIVRS